MAMFKNKPKIEINIKVPCFTQKQMQEVMTGIKEITQEHSKDYTLVFKVDVLNR